MGKEELLHSGVRSEKGARQYHCDVNKLGANLPYHPLFQTYNWKRKLQLENENISKLFIDFTISFGPPYTFAKHAFFINYIKQNELKSQWFKGRRKEE